MWRPYDLSQLLNSTAAAQMAEDPPMSVAVFYRNFLYKKKWQAQRNHSLYSKIVGGGECKGTKW